MKPYQKSVTGIFPGGMVELFESITAQKMKFSVKDFFSKYGQIRRKLKKLNLLKKFLIENFIFCGVNLEGLRVSASDSKIWICYFRQLLFTILYAYMLNTFFPMKGKTTKSSRVINIMGVFGTQSSIYDGASLRK